jgi:hypothetical protein
MSSFKNWNRDKLNERFGLKRTINHHSLLVWLNSSAKIDDIEKTILLRLREKMLLYVDYWNEEEVKLKFIGHIITLADYDTENLSAFVDRYFEGEVDGEILNGKPDFIVARGKQEMKSPFFFLHEYKKELDNDSPDPAGQLLAAMLLAYEHNLQVPELSQKPIYGVYVVGRQWFFVILQGREYSISDSYSSTHEDELLDIFRIMKANREKIREIWGE